MSWIFEPHNTIFATAFVVMLGFALLETVSLVLGLGISHHIADLLHLPDFGDAGGVDGQFDADVSHGDPHAHSPLDHSGHAHHAGVFPQFMGWLEVGKVPFLVTLNFFLGSFSLLGFTIQSIAIESRLGPLPGWLAAISAFVLALPVLKLGNRWIGRLWPQDETSAFPSDALIGRVGHITIGTATQDRSAEVKVIGPDRHTHYVMVYAIDEPLEQGADVLLCERLPNQPVYRGRRGTGMNLP